MRKVKPKIRCIKCGRELFRYDPKYNICTNCYMKEDQEGRIKYIRKKLVINGKDNFVEVNVGDTKKWEKD